ncbi:unnamed protein product [Rotaria magnacalcarata]|uniref:EF-hand domain-containing protein n=1 Tax=Rotaria magnacalcarata TaxID=392030 RepID=A0A816V4A3_9BILA|nr:unnamed protein product [Rotaria magnacalcarata]CAF2122977.1 unnamed protein product [Rotaria magnacalcarata]CAF4009881.1 unnamed protein product [Rotaria magnacalcarata]CAF4150627.1 unnamed protein product [Rotaria magnacalcarata]
MARHDAVDELYKEVDTNRDGRIDKNELRNWMSTSEGFTPSSYESTITSRDLINDTVIRTSSSEETNRYLARSMNHIFKDINPKIIRRAETERPVTCEQRVIVRYLQPPPLPPGEPLIIKEVRPEQPPPPPPLIIHEQATTIPQEPPLILRERPPTAVRGCSSETTIRYLPAIPVPPRSVIVERFPPPPEKKGDIIIERWLPYGPRPERPTIVQRAASTKEYPQPSITIHAYDNVQLRIVRKVEQLGVTQEDPDDYIARYGRSLLDSATLVHEARNAGVVEDISAPPSSSSITTHKRGNIVDFDYSAGTGYEGTQRVANTEFAVHGSRSYSPSRSRVITHSASAGSTSEVHGGYRADDGVVQY